MVNNNKNNFKELIVPVIIATRQLNGRASDIEIKKKAYSIFYSNGKKYNVSQNKENTRLMIMLNCAIYYLLDYEILVNTNGIYVLNEHKISNLIFKEIKNNKTEVSCY